MRGKVSDLVGQRFGNLTVIEFIEIKNSKSYWKCRCDCGNEVVRPISSLKWGRSNNHACKYCMGKKRVQVRLENKRKGIKTGEYESKLYKQYKSGYINLDCLHEPKLFMQMSEQQQVDNLHVLLKGLGVIGLLPRMSEEEKQSIIAEIKQERNNEHVANRNATS